MCSGGLEPPTSALVGPKRCAAESGRPSVGRGVTWPGPPGGRGDHLSLDNGLQAEYVAHTWRREPQDSCLLDGSYSCWGPSYRCSSVPAAALLPPRQPPQHSRGPRRSSQGCTARLLLRCGTVGGRVVGCRFQTEPSPPIPQAASHPPLIPLMEVACPTTSRSSGGCPPHLRW